MMTTSGHERLCHDITSITKQRRIHQRSMMKMKPLQKLTIHNRSIKNTHNINTINTNNTRRNTPKSSSTLKNSHHGILLILLALSVTIIPTCTFLPPLLLVCGVDAFMSSPLTTSSTSTGMYRYKLHHGHHNHEYEKQKQQQKQKKQFVSFSSTTCCQMIATTKSGGKPMLSVEQFQNEVLLQNNNKDKDDGDNERREEQKPILVLYSAPW